MGTKNIIKEIYNERMIQSLIEMAKDTYKREGLLETPQRVVEMFKDFFKPTEDFIKWKTFKSEGNDEMIVVKQIPFYSYCEHHMVPFFGTAHIAYIPKGQLVGLSKIPRVLDYFSRRLQNQERITKQVNDYLMQKLKPWGVGVILDARHLCVEMRGIRKPGTMTTTSAMSGCFKTDTNCRQEFLKLINL